jgi:D-serine deaminase-like pyridoxal phosphate-dependent protein
MGRCGARSIDEAVRLAGLVHAAPGVAFRGMFGYEGHAVAIADRSERERIGRAANAVLVKAAESVRAQGIPVEIVTGGGTGTYDIAGSYPGMTEIEAGSYIFMDDSYAKLDLPFRQALTVVSTVISRPQRETVIFDVGMKGISVERFFPRVLDTAGIVVKKLSEAHAGATVVEAGLDPRPGDRFHLVPSHCCTTVNLYPELVAVRDGVVEAVWPVTGRGA